MEKIIVKYVKGLSENATSWERRNHKRYGGIANVSRQIRYDIKHGATNDDLLSLLQKIRNDTSYSNLREYDGSLGRLLELESEFPLELTSFSVRSLR
jgi:hypothetical protein